MRTAHIGVPGTKPVHGLERGRAAAEDDDVVRLAIVLPAGEGNTSQLDRWYYLLSRILPFPLCSTLTTHRYTHHSLFRIPGILSARHCPCTLDITDLPTYPFSQRSILRCPSLIFASSLPLNLDLAFRVPCLTPLQYLPVFHHTHSL